MRTVTTLALTFAVSLAAFAQTGDAKPDLHLYHPSGPPLAYDVATIKLIDPSTANGMVRLPPGMSVSPLSLRRYIMNAYGTNYSAQVVGGPDWLNKDSYNIKGKVPDDLQAAQQTMKREDRLNQTRGMEQALLADRFRLKAHFETRVLPVYEMVPAKGGLTITEVPAPPERKPGDAAPPPLRIAGALVTTGVGVTMTIMNPTGLRVTNARAVKMQALANVVGFSGAAEMGDRPIVDHTGFTGYFDIKDPPGRPSVTPMPPTLPTLRPSFRRWRSSLASNSSLPKPPSRSSSSTVSTAPRTISPTLSSPHSPQIPPNSLNPRRNLRKKLGILVLPRRYN